MRCVLGLLLFLIASTSSFQMKPATETKHLTETSRLFAMNRREVVVGGLGLVGLIMAPSKANAKPASTFFWDDQIETVREPAQMPTDGKFDLNAQFVGEYKVFPGMFPHAAGKIASNGPYNKVSDIYKISGLNQNDINMFKKYEKFFTVNPPGRAFNERINARVST